MLILRLIKARYDVGIVVTMLSVGLPTMLVGGQTVTTNIDGLKNNPNNYQGVYFQGLQVDTSKPGPQEYQYTGYWEPSNHGAQIFWLNRSNPWHTNDPYLWFSNIPDATTSEPNPMSFWYVYYKEDGSTEQVCLWDGATKSWNASIHNGKYQFESDDQNFQGYQIKYDFQWRDKGGSEGDFTWYDETVFGSNYNGKIWKDISFYS